jgi:hypothetical protein
VEGRTVFTTDDIIEDQHYSIFSFRWVADFERFDRMYALIDPAGKIDENKEDNNKAWAPVQRFGPCGEVLGTDPGSSLFETFAERFTIYPNPAGTLVNLDYSGPYFTHADIAVVDMAGRTWLRESMGYSSGNSQYTLDTGDLEPGMYILVISTDQYRQQTKLMVE